MVANSIYGYPSIYGNDFMSQMTFGTNPQQMALQQALIQGAQQPQTDTFEKRGTNPALKLGAAAGIGTGAGYYFFGNGPVSSEGRFADEILKSVEQDTKKLGEANAKKAVAEAYDKVFAKHKFGGKKVTTKEFKAIVKYVKLVENGEKIPAKLKAKVPSEIITDISKGKAFIKEVSKIDAEKIAKQAIHEANLTTLGGQLDDLKNLQSAQSKLLGIADKATKKDMVEFFKNNAKEFGLEGNAEEIEKGAKNLAAKYSTKKKAIDAYKTMIEKRQNSIKTLRETLNGKVSTYYDAATKTVKSGAPENLTKALKNFKWKKAGKYGAIAAGAGIVLGWLFGGKS